MKLIFLIFFVGTCTAALLDRGYIPPIAAPGRNSGFPSKTVGTIPGVGGVPGTITGGPFSGSPGPRPQDAAAQILSQFSDVTSEGFSYHFETSNGIKASESGLATNGVQAQGEFSYTGDDGQLYKITYTADENGYMPVGAHLPTSPPIPEDILRSLEQNAKDETNGIFNEGSYREDPTSSGSQGKSSAPTYGGLGSSYSPGIQGQTGQQAYNPSTGYKY